MKTRLLASVASIASSGMLALSLMVAAPGAARASAVCPATSYTGTNADNCNFMIEFGAGGAITTYQEPGATDNYDGSDDALIGVLNNSGHTINSFNVSSTSNSFGGIFGGMDGDGINRYTGLTNAAAGKSSGPGFGGLPAADIDDNGVDVYFYAATATSGTVYFLNGLANGATDYFSLEEPLNIEQPPVVNSPEPGSLALLGLALAGMGMARRRRC